MIFCFFFEKGTGEGGRGATGGGGGGGGRRGGTARKGDPILYLLFAWCRVLCFVCVFFFYVLNWGVG